MSQLILCRTFGSNAQIYLYEDSKLYISFNGYIGKNGAKENIFEGSRCTPKGTFKVGSVFYKNNNPNPLMPSFKITNNTYFVDDCTSELYNSKVEYEGVFPFSAEKMIDYEGYSYGFVIEYNTNPVIKGKGSAIFFHCGNGPTCGCVAASKSDVLKTIAWLNPYKNPYIKIV